MKNILFILVFSIALIFFDYIYLKYFIPLLINVFGNYFWILIILLLFGFLFKAIGSVLNILVLPISFPISFFDSVVIYKAANVLIIINAILFTINIIDFDLRLGQKIAFLLFFYFIQSILYKKNKEQIFYEQ